MTLGVSDPATGVLRVYARRFTAGTVTLGPNQAPSMYAVVLKPSVLATSRRGWTLLSYDLDYLFEIISRALEYDVNNI